MATFSGRACPAFSYLRELPIWRLLVALEFPIVLDPVGNSRDTDQSSYRHHYYRIDDLHFEVCYGFSIGNAHPNIHSKKNSPTESQINSHPNRHFGPHA